MIYVLLVWRLVAYDVYAPDMIGTFQSLGQCKKVMAVMDERRFYKPRTAISKSDYSKLDPIIRGIPSECRAI